VADTPRDLVLPDGVDDQGYERLRRLMRVSVLRVWAGDRVIAGMDPWSVVDEAWASMASSGFASAGPFEPFALRVAKNKALDAVTRAEARRRDRSLEEPIGRGMEEGGGLVVADTIVGSAGADDEYLSMLEESKDVRRVSLVEEAIFGVLSDVERDTFNAVVRDGKSRAAVGRDLDPPITGQRVGQIVAAATIKIKAYVEEHEESDDE
jgi:DNA-directed RNA polymerase specialized sigma24 family protein